MCVCLWANGTAVIARPVCGAFWLPKLEGPSVTNENTMIPRIGKMECGQFVGKIKPDKDSHMHDHFRGLEVAIYFCWKWQDVERLARKFKLDDHVTSRLTELKVCRRTLLLRWSKWSKHESRLNSKE